MGKVEKIAVKAIKVETANETHMQVFARLSNPAFNSGAMHGTPGQRKGKQS